jgi:hypothetical protein
MAHHHPACLSHQVNTTRDLSNHGNQTRYLYFNNLLSDGLLQQAGIIKPGLAANLQRIAGFRNIAVHDYQTMEVPILVQIIEEHLTDFLEFSQVALRQGDTVPHPHP